MKKRLKKFITLLIIFKTFGSSVSASDDLILHEKCLKAADYKGCVKSNKKVTKGFNSKGDICDKNTNAVDGFCLAGEGKDLLDRPKITGWIYRELPELKGNIYINPDFKQLIVNNNFGRYLTTKYIVRTFREFIPDRAPQEITIGDSKTFCTQSGLGSTYFFGDSRRGSTNYFGNLNCTTKNPEKALIGGQYGQTEGVNQNVYLSIYDCDTREYSTKLLSEKNENLSEWKPVGGFSRSLLNESCELYLMRPKSDIKDFAKIKLRD